MRLRLAFASPSLAKATKVLSPPGNVGPVDILAELAAIDGLRDHRGSLRALDQASDARTSSEGLRLPAPPVSPSDACGSFDAHGSLDARTRHVPQPRKDRGREQIALACLS